MDNPDHNLRVDGIPPSIRGKITLLIACAEGVGACKGGPMEGDAQQVMNHARYNLEATIKTHLDRKGKTDG